MAWVIGLLIALLAISLVGLFILYEQTQLQARMLEQVALMRRELAAGLGVNIDDPHGYLDEGHLAEIIHDVRDKRKREREEREAHRAEEMDRHSFS